MDTHEAGIVRWVPRQSRVTRRPLVTVSPVNRQRDVARVALHHRGGGCYNADANHMARRRRKPLPHRSEINKLAQKPKETGHTVVPVEAVLRMVAETVGDR